MGPAAPQPTLQHLRETLAGIDPHLGPALPSENRQLELSPPVDAALGGGLACGALHELAPAAPFHLAAASGFAAAAAAPASGTPRHAPLIPTALPTPDSARPTAPPP